MERFAKLNNPPRFGLDRERAEHALIKVENGYMLKRDPDNGNRKPIGEGAGPRRPPREMWAELGMVKTPTILVRGPRRTAIRRRRSPVDPIIRISSRRRSIPSTTLRVGAGCAGGACAQVHQRSGPRPST